MIKEKEIMLESTTYKIRQLPATEGASLLVYLTKTFGGVVKGLKVKSDQGNDNLMDRDISSMVEGLLSNFHEEETVNKVKKLIYKSIVTPKGFDFDIDLAGEYDTMGMLVFEILKFNFEKSFEKMKKKVGHIISFPEIDNPQE